MPGVDIKNSKVSNKLGQLLREFSASNNPIGIQSMFEGASGGIPELDGLIKRAGRQHLAI